MLVQKQTQQKYLHPSSVTPRTLRITNYNASPEFLKSALAMVKDFRYTLVNLPALKYFHDVWTLCWFGMGYGAFSGTGLTLLSWEVV
jgi:hypothetical protein